MSKTYLALVALAAQCEETGRECTVCHEREGSGCETPTCEFEEERV